MQCDSKNNAVQLAELQQRIDQTLAVMSRFVRSQLDAAAPSDVAADAGLLSAAAGVVTDSANSSHDANVTPSVLVT